MNQQTLQSDNFTKLSSSSIEKLLNRYISDEYYELTTQGSLINLSETKENA